MIRLTLALLVLLTWEPRLLSAQEKFGLPDTTLLDVQEKEAGVPASAKLSIYKTKSLLATEAAELVRSMMGNAAHIVADPVGNSLLIRAAEPQLKEIQAVLQTLDQPPQLIAFEVTIADLPAKAEDAQAEQEQPASDEAWLARLKSPEGKITAKISTLRLTATENQQAMVQFGEQTPVVAGVQQAFGRGGGGRSPIVQQTQTGTIVKCTARVLEDDVILAELEIERSRLAPESGAVVEESDDRDALRTPGQLTTTCKTTVKLKPGKPRVISGLKSQTGNGSTLSVIAISAELVGSEK